MCKQDVDKEIEEFLKSKQKFKLLMKLYFLDKKHEKKEIKLEPPVKEGFGENDTVIYIKKQKHNAGKLF
jgi:hypothetical protein